MKEKIRFIQQKLKQSGFNPGKIDGILGPKTLQALSKVKGIPQGYSAKRTAIAYIQLLCQQQKIEVGAIDGYWGPQTQQAFETLKVLEEFNAPPPSWRPEDLPNKNPNNWPVQDQASLNNYYGSVGTNLVYVELPYVHRLAWNTNQKVTRLQCHKKVEPSVHRVLTKVLQHYGEERIRELGLDLTGGCFNKRKMRGGNKWSTHSWGIALDYDPSHNQLKWGRDKARFAKPEYDAWWKIWEDEGWVSLGRTRNFDWMHVQAAKIV